MQCFFFGGGGGISIEYLHYTAHCSITNMYPVARHLTVQCVHQLYQHWATMNGQHTYTHCQCERAHARGMWCSTRAGAHVTQFPSEGLTSSRCSFLNSMCAHTQDSIAQGPIQEVNCISTYKHRSKTTSPTRWVSGGQIELTTHYRTGFNLIVHTLLAGAMLRHTWPPPSQLIH